eukprot:SAG22_NODE_536_length_9364_cov_15.973988_12_plen_130_part_00
MVACSDTETLCAVVLCTIPLLGPLHYEGTLVPVLAPEMYDVVHSPGGSPNAAELATAAASCLHHACLMLGDVLWTCWLTCLPCDRAVPYLVGVPELSSIPEFHEGFLGHVHTLHVDGARDAVMTLYHTS